MTSPPPIPKPSKWARFVAWVKAGGWKWLLLVPAVFAGLAFGARAVMRLLGMGKPDPDLRKADEHKGASKALETAAKDVIRKTDKDTERAERQRATLDRLDVALRKTDEREKAESAETLKAARGTDDADVDGLADLLRDDSERDR